MLNPKSWIRWQVLVPIPILGGLILYLFVVPEEGEVPFRLGGLELRRTLDKQESARIINHLHGKGVTPIENVIGLYESEAGEAVVYKSKYSTAIEAQAALKRMASLIEEGNPIFDNYRIEVIRGKQISFCVGQGQDHYFFSAGDKLYWLAVDFPISRKTAEHLVGEVADQ